MCGHTLVGADCGRRPNAHHVGRGAGGKKVRTLRTLLSIVGWLLLTPGAPKGARAHRSERKCSVSTVRTSLNESK